jgi:RNA polymerase I-specific transcription initiation factor RRN6
MASSIAADLILACNVLRVEETEPKLEPAGQDPESQTQEPWSSQPTFSQQTSALPTPSITPSITTASSHPSSFAAPELLRLSKYTTFSKPVPTILPRSLRRVLAHWKPGAQPDDYDWLSTSRNLTQKDNEEEDEGMPERERKRLQRRADRHIRRQRKEAAASEAMQLASSQAPAIFSASQPMAVQVESQPSAVAQSSQMTIRGGPYAGATSQVVAGRFGGRPPAKKKRKQGF